MGIFTERSRTENQKNSSVERLGGIEPPSPGWKPDALPMSYSRVSAGGCPPAFSGGGKNELKPELPRLPFLG